MRRRRFVGCLLVGISLLVRSAGYCGSLTSLLGIPASRVTRVVADPFVSVLQQNLATATDFPATATGGGFSYRLDTATGALERLEQTLGPTILDRGRTIGKGLIDVNVSYLYADFTTIDGDDLDDLVEPVLFETLGFLDKGTIHFEEFALRTNAVYVSATYGVLERLDVNVLVPILATSLSVRKRATTQALGPLPAQPSQEKHALGVGDVQLRSKYMIYDRERWALAGLLWIRAASGDEANFQGFGDWTVRPGLALSVDEGMLGAYGNLSIDIDASDLPRSRVWYGLGASYRLLADLTANLELVGASQVADDTQEVFLPGVSRGAIRLGNFQNVSVTPAIGGVEVVQTIPAENVVDLAPGLKWQYGRMVLFASVLIPLTRDGVRAPAIPLVGFDLRF